MRTLFRTRLHTALAAAAAVAIVLALLGCTQDDADAVHGGGSDTETLTGHLVTSEGKPAAGARVKLIPSTYNPNFPDSSQIRVAVTNSSGRYSFRKVSATGSYNLLAAGADSGSAFREALPADYVPDTVRLETSRVIRLTMYGEGYSDYQPGHAWFPGTDILVICERDTAMTMDRLPRSLNELVLESRAGWRHDVTIKVPGDTVVILANREMVVFNPYWLE